MGSVEKQNATRRKPARTVEEMENRMMAAAITTSYQRLVDGSASSAEIIYWLKRASPSAKLEEDNLRLQGELLRAKRDEIMSNQAGNQDYKAVMDAFAGYQPTSEIEDGDFREL